VPEAQQRLEGIAAEIEEAFAILEKVLDHIDATKPDAAPRVVMTNNVIVALVGTMEEGIRSILGEYLSILQESIPAPTGLREGLRSANLLAGIERLKALADPNDHPAAIGISQEVTLWLNNGPGYKLFRDELTRNRFNFNSKELTEVLGRCGVAKIWHALCGTPRIQARTRGVTVEARVSELVTEWNEIFKERNLIVHRVSQATGWARNKIDESIGLFRDVLHSLVVCLVADIQEQLATPQGARRARPPREVRDALSFPIPEPDRISTRTNGFGISSWIHSWIDSARQHWEKFRR
jgi:hypothetical protein